MFQQKMQEEEENRFCIYRNKTFNRRKIMIIFVAVLLLMVFLMGRLVYLMIFCSEYYGVRAENLHERERDIKAARGNIYDRNGVVLAENKTVCTISVIHSQIEDPEKVIAVLTKELGMSEETVRKRVEKVSSIERIKTNVEKETGDAIRSYELAGVKIDDIDLIGVTHGPGLVGALIIGVAAAKALSFAKDIPLVGVHHLHGHISANYIARSFLCLCNFKCLLMSQFTYNITWKRF